MFWSTNALPAHLPLAEGPFVPGCIDVMSGFGADGVFMRFYYPTALDNVKKYKLRWPRWAPDHEQYLEGFASVLGIFTFLLRLAKTFISGDVHIPAVWGAEPVDADKLPKMPVIVVSHGLGACRFFYSTICLQLASYGYLVACLEHRDESAAATYFYQNDARLAGDKKTWLPFRPMSVSASQIVVRQRQLQVRAAECSRALDVLQDISEGRSTLNLLDVDNSHNFLDHLKGRLDLSTATLMGHSFGGATALTVAASEKRYKQMIILDSWLYALKNEHLLSLAGSDIPKLYINTETFQQPNNLSVMRKFINSNKDTFYTIKATTHEHQCDSPLLLGMWLNMGMKKLDPQLALNISANLILQFLENKIGKPGLWNNETFLQETEEHLVKAISISECKL